MAKHIPTDQREAVFGSLIGQSPARLPDDVSPARSLTAPHPPSEIAELTSEALGATIHSVSDEFFAEAQCLLRVPVSAGGEQALSAIGARGAAAAELTTGPAEMTLT